MHTLKRMLAAGAAVLLFSAPSAAAAEHLALRSHGRPVLVSAVAAAYGTQIVRSGEPAGDVARTGDQLADGRVLIISGDLTGDGKIDLTDLIRAAQGLRQDVDALSVEAGDINGSGSIDMSDIVAIAGMMTRSARVPLAELPPFPLDFFELQAPDLIREVNTYRASRGLTPLTERTDMSTFCRIRADEQMSDAGWNLSHQRPGGSGFWEGALYPPSGEVLAHCWTEPETGAYMNAAACAVEQWIHSPAHEEILLNPTAAWIGAGIAYGRGPDGNWWWKACVHIAHDPA